LLPFQHPFILIKLNIQKGKILKSSEFCFLALLMHDVLNPVTIKKINTYLCTITFLRQ